MAGKKNKVIIPDELYKKIDAHIQGTEFQSVEDFVLKSIESALEAAKGLSDEDEEKVKARLKALGYMD